MQLTRREMHDRLITCCRSAQDTPDEDACNGAGLLLAEFLQGLRLFLGQYYERLPAPTLTSRTGIVGTKIPAEQKLNPGNQFIEKRCRILEIQDSGGQNAVWYIRDGER